VSLSVINSFEVYTFIQKENTGLTSNFKPEPRRLIGGWYHGPGKSKIYHHVIDSGKGNLVG